MGLGVSLIGKAAIKIIPDTDDFKKDLKRKLGKGGDDGNNPTIEFDGDFKDMREQFRRQTQEMRDEMNKTFREGSTRSATNMNMPDIGDDSEFRRSMRDATSNGMVEGLYDVKRKLRGEGFEIPGAFRIQTEDLNKEAKRSMNRIKPPIMPVKPLVSNAELEKEVSRFSNRTLKSMKSLGVKMKGMDSIPFVSPKWNTGVKAGVSALSDSFPRLGKMGRRVASSMSAMGSSASSMGSSLLRASSSGSRLISGALRPLSNIAKSNPFKFMKGSLTGVTNSLTKMGGNRVLGGMTKMLGKIGGKAGMWGMALKAGMAMKGLGDRFKTTASNMSGLDQIGNINKDLLNFGQNIGKLPAKWGPKVLGFEALRSGLIAVGGHFLSLGKSVASLIGIVGVLPGAFAVGGAGALIMKRAMADMGTEMKGTIDQFKALGNVVSKNFWKQARGPLTEMADTLMPEIEAGSKKAATALGGMAASFGNAVSKASGNTLEVVFNSLSKSAEMLSGHFDKVVNGLMRVIAVGANELPRLTEGLGGVLDKFGDWMTKISASGQLSSWIRGAVDGFSDLASIIYSTVSIFNAFGSAAESVGGATLGSVATALRNIRETVNSTGFREGLVTVFDAAFQSMSNLANIAGPAVANVFKVFPAMFREIAPAVGAAVGNLISFVANIVSSQSVVSGYTNFVMSLTRAVDNLRPAFESAVGPVSHLFEVLSYLTESQSASVGKWMEMIHNYLNAIAPMSSEVAYAMADVGAAIIEIGAALGNWFAGNAAQSVGHFVTMFQKLRERVSIAKDMIMSFGRELNARVGPALKFCMDAVSEFAAVTIDALFSIVGEVGGFVMSFLRMRQVTVGLGYLAATVGVAFKGLTLLVKALRIAINGIIRGFTILADVMSWLATPFEWLLNKMGFIGKVSKEAGDEISGSMGDAASKTHEAATSIGSDMDIMSGSITTGAESSNNAIRTFGSNAAYEFGRVNSASSDARMGFGENMAAMGVDASLGAESISQSLYTMANSVDVESNRAVAQLRNSMGTMSQAYKMSLQDVNMYTRSSKEQVTASMTDMRGAVSSSMQDASDSAKEMSSSVSTSMSTTSDAVRQQTHQMRSDVKAQVNEFGREGGKMSDTWSSNVDSFNSKSKTIPTSTSTAMAVTKGVLQGFENSSGNILHRAGAAIMEGLKAGISSKINSLKSQLSGITAMIPRFKGPMDRDKKLLTPAGIAIMDSLMNGLESRLPQLRSTLKEITREIEFSPVASVGDDLARALDVRSLRTRSLLADMDGPIINQYVYNNNASGAIPEEEYENALRRMLHREGVWFNG